MKTLKRSWFSYNSHVGTHKSIFPAELYVVQTNMLSCDLCFSESHTTNPMAQAVPKLISKLNSDWHEAKKREGLKMVPWQPVGPFTFSGSTAEPCWDKPFVDTLQKHRGCSQSKQCSLGKQPRGRSLYILSCNCLPVLDENKNPTQTGYNSLIISAGQLGAITSPPSTVLFALWEGSISATGNWKRACSDFYLARSVSTFAFLHTSFSLQTRQGNWASPPHVLTWLQNLFAAYLPALCFHLIQNCCISTSNVLRLDGQFANTNTYSKHPERGNQAIQGWVSAHSSIKKSLMTPGWWQ